MAKVPNPVHLPPRYARDLVHIGSGGFGAVYRTRDEVLGISVAVKVPTGAESRRQARAVLLELRAAAALRHEGFVQVLDADLDPGGVPYLVMEFADGGPLQGRCAGGAIPWTVAAPWIRQLFEGLAYAHAQGLVHRDVKLDNVLLKRDDGGVRAKLADFGLTKVQSGVDFAPTRLLAGTLLYMPPEAFEDDAALIHPGVDLYAMGVLMYLMLAGRSPWTARDLALISAKVDGRHRPLEPSETVPARVAAVVNRLLDPDARARYQLAADCIDDLFGDGHQVAPLTATMPTVHEGDSSVSRSPLAASALPSDMDSATRDLVRLRQPPPALAIVREPMLVGRRKERSRLWEAARFAGSGPVGVVLSGARGSGRSRLSRWLAAALEQGGYARTLHVRFEPTVAPSEAVAVALRRFLLLGRALGDELRGRIQGWLRGHGEQREEDVAGLLGWLDPSAPAPGHSVLDAREAAVRRLALLERVLRLESRRGLVVVWWEESGGSTGGAPLATSLLRSAGADPFPLLTLYDRDDEGDLPDAFADWTPVHLPPLHEPALEELLLDLAVPPDRVHAMARRAKGSPARAVEAARLHCSGQGALASLSARGEHESTGLAETIPAQAPVSIPEDPFGDTADIDPAELALVRLQGFCDGESTGDASDRAARRRLIKLLALLPRPTAPARLDHLWPNDIGEDCLAVAIDDACMAGVLRRDQEGWLDFTGAPLVQAAAEYIEQAPDAALLRVACARELASDGASPGMLWAAAKLQQAAGATVDALELLIRAADRLALQDTEAAARVWGEARELLGGADLPPDDVRRVRVWLGSAQAARDLGSIDEAEKHLAHLDGAEMTVVSVAARHELRASIFALRTDLPASQAEAELALRRYQEAGEPGGIARARLFIGDVLARAGKREDAVAVFEQALGEATAAGEERIALWARWLRARCLRGLGRRDEAKAELGEVLAHASRVGVAVVEGGALRELGNLAVRAGESEEAEGLLRRSVERLDRAGQKVEAATTRISLGELERARGNLAEARAAYSTAFAVLRAYGLTSDVLVTLINLGIVELAMGRGRRAGRRLDEIDKLLPREQPHGLRRYVQALRVACLAEQERWEDAEETVDALMDAGALPPDPDLLWLLEHAGGRAHEAGEASLAADAWDLALGIAESLSDDDAAARLRAAMRGA